MKKWLFFSIFAVLLLTSSGCQQPNSINNNQESFDLRKDQSAPGNMSYHSVGRDKYHYVEDDITNQNPNFLDLNNTGSGTETGSPNFGLDVDKARQTVAETTKFTPGSVWINNKGDHMRVTVYKKGKLTRKEKKDAANQVREKLMSALPRYTFDVTVLEDNRKMP